MIVQQPIDRLKVMAKFFYILAAQAFSN